MACPFFYPLEVRSVAAGILPLGDLWAGECRASDPCPAEGMPCNLGYARGNCARFPASSEGADAVRFTIAAHQDERIQLYYVLERDHHPFAHGPLEYSLQGRILSNHTAETVFERQALAYVESYLRRKNLT